VHHFGQSKVDVGPISAKFRGIIVFRDGQAKEHALALTDAEFVHGHYIGNQATVRARARSCVCGCAWKARVCLSNRERSGCIGDT
jgi:hypothetical protein